MSIVIRDNGNVECDGGAGYLCPCEFELLYEGNAQCGNCPIVELHQKMVDLDVLTAIDYVNKVNV